MSQMCTTSRKVLIKYVIYKIIDPHKYLLMTLDSKILRGFLWTWGIKPGNRRTNQGNAQNLSQLKQVMNMGIKI